MIARDKCEICSVFSKVSFTDCGLICESCFNKELQISAYNYAIDQCIKTIKQVENWPTLEDVIKLIEPLKKKDHKKDNL